MSTNPKPAVQPQQATFPQTATVSQPGVTYPQGMQAVGGQNQAVFGGQVSQGQFGQGYPAVGGTQVAGYQTKPSYPPQGAYQPTGYGVQPKQGVVGATYAPQPVATLPQQAQQVQQAQQGVKATGTVPVQQPYNYPPYQQKVSGGNIGQPQVIPQQAVQQKFSGPQLAHQQFMAAQNAKAAQYAQTAQIAQTSPAFQTKTSGPMVGATIAPNAPKVQPPVQQRVPTD